MRKLLSLSVAAVLALTMGACEEQPTQLDQKVKANTDETTYVEAEFAASVVDEDEDKVNAATCDKTAKGTWDFDGMVVLRAQGETARVKPGTFEAPFPVDVGGDPIDQPCGQAFFSGVVGAVEAAFPDDFPDPDDLNAIRGDWETNETEVSVEDGILQWHPFPEEGEE